MTQKIALKDALKQWEENNPDIPLAQAKEVKLQFKGIDRMDGSLIQIQNVEKLSLSTNHIDKIVGLNPLKNLKILALGRNLLKAFTGLEPLGNSLEQLWISYNFIEKTMGIGSLKKLKVLYISQNMVREWVEFQRFAECPLLEEMVFNGNPLAESLNETDYKIEIRKRLPTLKKLDGEVLT